jgi:hypothetical protein
MSRRTPTKAFSRWAENYFYIIEDNPYHIMANQRTHIHIWFEFVHIHQYLWTLFGAPQITQLKKKTRVRTTPTDSTCRPHPVAEIAPHRINALRCARKWMDRASSDAAAGSVGPPGQAQPHRLRESADRRDTCDHPPSLAAGGTRRNMLRCF